MKKAAEQKSKDGGGGGEKPPVVKTQRIIKPAQLVTKTYLETQDDVEAFLTELRQQLERAIAENERIQIR